MSFESMCSRGKSISSDESGSAVTEFVLIATPLFLPAILFFLSMHSTATEEINVSHLARQAVRAFITAESVDSGHQRVKFLLDRHSDLEVASSNAPLSLRTAQGTAQGTARISKGGVRHYGFTYNISCSAEKCLTPGSLVELRLYREFQLSSDKIISNTGSTKKAVAIARSYVDKWRAES